jgi:ABC-2 type transport system permease protein
MGATLNFTTSAWLLLGYRLRQFFNLFRFGRRKDWLWAFAVLLLGLLFIKLDHLFFLRLIAAIQEKLEFLAPFMLQQLIHTLFLSFFGLLALSSMSSSISGFYMSREIPFLLSSPVSPTAFILQRFTLVFFQSSWMILVFGAPPFFAYADRLGLGWHFIAGGAATFFLLVTIPVVLGCTLGMLLMKMLPASRVNQAVSFISLAVAALIIMFFRMSRPERLFMDVPTEEVMDFVQAMTVPESPYMPTSWATNAVVSLSTEGAGDVYFSNIMFLLAASLATIVLFYVVFRSFYRSSLASVDEGRVKKKRKEITLVERMLNRHHPVTGSYLTKDILLFARDPSRWTQLFLLGALVVLYVYNAYSFPLGGMFYRNLVAFLNLAIAGFVLSALCVRFVFPSVSLEGQAMWITLSSPVSMKRFFMAKYLFAALPLCLVSLVLSITTNLVMGIQGSMMILCSAASLAMALALTGLSLGMGALYPRFDYENEAQVPASPGGVASMILSLGYIGFMVVLLAAPVYRLFAYRMGLSALTSGDALFGLIAAGLLSILVGVVPMGIGLRKVGDWASTR